MIPQQRLSTVTFYDNIMLADPQPSNVISREWGGTALNDGSDGLEVKIWTCTVIPSGIPLVPDEIVVYADDVLPTVVFTALDVSEISLAFDQNMRPFVAYVSQGNAKFYWYDSLIEGTRITDLPIGSSSPRCTLDDHRATQLSTSDIILAYIQNGNLYFRAQRDRYEVQYLLYADINLDIISPTIHYVKMNLINRLQFSIRGNFGGS